MACPCDQTCGSQWVPIVRSDATIPARQHPICRRPESPRSRCWASLAVSEVHWWWRRQAGAGQNRSFGGAKKAVHRNDRKVPANPSIALDATEPGAL